MFTHACCSWQLSFCAIPRGRRDLAHIMRERVCGKSGSKTPRFWWHGQQRRNDQRRGTVTAAARTGRVARTSTGGATSSGGATCRGRRDRHRQYERDGGSIGSGGATAEMPGRTGVVGRTRIVRPSPEEGHGGLREVGAAVEESTRLAVRVVSRAARIPMAEPAALRRFIHCTSNPTATLFTCEDCGASGQRCCGTYPNLTCKSVCATRPAIKCP